MRLDRGQAQAELARQVLVAGAVAQQQGDLALARGELGEGVVAAGQGLGGQLQQPLQGPQAADALQRLLPEVQRLVFMTGSGFQWQGADLFVTRSGYTGEDGFEISVPAAQAEALARALLAQPEVQPAGLGARNSLRLEAGLCLYGNDIDTTTTPVEPALTWAIQKVRRTGGARPGGFPGAARVLAQLDGREAIARN